MINFRFHIVSLIAVFLAVGLGILVGSTVVDQKIVNRLDTEIHSVREENAQRKAESEQLADENSQLRQFIDESALFSGDARLDGQSVAVVAERGVDGGVLDQTEKALRAAGADVPAVMWLEDSWKLDTEQQKSDLEEALGLQGTTAQVRDGALRLLARRLADPTSKRAGRVDALAALERAGFLSVSNGNASDFDTFPEHVAHALVVTGDDGHLQGTDLTSAFSRALTRAKLPTVVGAAYDAGSDPANTPERGATLASILDDGVLSDAISTVDDLELMQGRVAAVLALEAVAGGDIGHYGYGSGAKSPLPPHQT